MGSVGDAYDNALCESFFATLECELLDRRRFATQVEARLAVFEYIEGWYNPHRRHSALDYESPISYEKKHRAGRLTRKPITVHGTGATPVLLSVCGYRQRDAAFGASCPGCCPNGVTRNDKSSTPGADRVSVSDEF